MILFINILLVIIAIILARVLYLLVKGKPLVLLIPAGLIFKKKVVPPPPPPPPPPVTPAATVITTVAPAPGAGTTAAPGTTTTTVVTPPAPHPPPAPAAPHGGDHAHGNHKNWETRIVEFFSGMGLVIATMLFICGMFYWQCWPETFYYRTGTKSKFVIEKNDTPINIVVTVLTKMTIPDGREVLIYPNGGGAKLLKKNPNLSPYIDQSSFENMGKGTYTLEVYAGQGEVASKTRVAIGKMSKLILKAFYYD